MEGKNTYLASGGAIIAGIATLLIAPASAPAAIIMIAQGLIGIFQRRATAKLEKKIEATKGKK